MRNVATAVVLVLISMTSLAVSASAPAMAGAAPWVIGGQPAAAGAWPWAALVTYTDAERSFDCSGAVIASNLVLTAGHCAVDMSTLTDESPSGYDVWTGSPTYNDSVGSWSTVSQVLVDPDLVQDTYQSGATSVDDDAAILVLTTPTSMQPISLASSSSDEALYTAGTPAEIIGWGLTDPNTPNEAPTLQSAETAVQSPTWCTNETVELASFTFDPGHQVCAIDAPTDSDGTCFGDSGGPLAAVDNSGNWVEIGITSQVLGNCATTAPQYFTRVASLAPWLPDEMADLGVTTAPTATTSTITTSATPTATSVAPAPGAKPGVKAGLVTDITRTAATLSATIDPHGLKTTWGFQYGINGYRSTVPRDAGAWTFAGAHTLRLNGLRPGTIYHYWVWAHNARGRTNGLDKTFKTLPAA